ncbi:jg9558, partial [Pararge aegeria aegeria]
ILIWSDAGLGAIMRSNVDGTSRVELARVNNVTALAVEQSSATVYWAVARQIHALDLDSPNRKNWNFRDADEKVVMD